MTFPPPSCLRICDSTKKSHLRSFGTLAVLYCISFALKDGNTNLDMTELKWYNLDNTFKLSLIVFNMEVTSSEKVYLNCIRDTLN